MSAFYSVQMTAPPVVTFIHHVAPSCCQAHVTTMRDIKKLVAEKYGLRVSALDGPDRTAFVSQARHEAMWRCRQLLGRDGKPRHSWPAIGRVFNRHHTSVMHGFRRHEERLALEAACS